MSHILSAKDRKRKSNNTSYYIYWRCKPNCTSIRCRVWL